MSWRPARDRSISTRSILWGDEEDPSLIDASEGALVIGPAIPTDDIYYSGIAGTAVAFGSGGEFFADSGSGAVVGLGTFEETSGGVIAVPEDAVSGAALGTSTATFANATLMSLGLTPGTYVWAWGSGATADSFTLEIATARGASAVPEPGTMGHDAPRPCGAHDIANKGSFRLAGDRRRRLALFRLRRGALSGTAIRSVPGPGGGSARSA